MDFQLNRKVLAALEREQVRYAIFGGVALNLHGLSRATQDIDLFVAPTEDNIARLRAALDSVFQDPDIAEISSEDLLGEYPAVQYNPPVEGYHLDILTRLGEVYDFDNLETQRLDFDGLEITVVTPRMLWKMKKDTVRPKDWDDAAQLRRRFQLED
jgi:hypothetical protein